MFDVIIVGAGPAGLSASHQAKELGLEYVCLEKEKVANTLLTYPHGKEIHYYPANVEVIGALPLPEGLTTGTIKAWQEFAKDLNIKEKEEVTEIKKEGDSFKVTTNKGEYEAKFIILAAGVQGAPRKVPIECKDDSKICYHISDPKSMGGLDVLVVGGGDTAIEHAVLLKEAGANVTVSYRKPEFFRLKDVNREAIEKSGIPCIFSSNVKCLEEGKAILDVDGKDKEIKADKLAVFAGTIPATDFLEKIGLKLENNKPNYDAESLESVDVEGLYIAGDLTKQPLIKPAINHGVQIINTIAEKL